MKNKKHPVAIPLHPVSTQNKNNVQEGEGKVQDTPDGKLKDIINRFGHLLINGNCDFSDNLICAIKKYGELVLEHPPQRNCSICGRKMDLIYKCNDEHII